MIHLHLGLHLRLITDK